jgi:hypothetical protein
MSTSTEKALERLLRKMSRAHRPRRSRFSTAPIVLALGLILAYQLLVRLVPLLWSELLPGHLEQAETFRGWPGLVWLLATQCHQNFGMALSFGACVVGAAVVICGWMRPLRLLVWIASVAVILLDAGIVYVAIRTALDASAQAAGLL